MKVMVRRLQSPRAKMIEMLNKTA